MRDPARIDRMIDKLREIWHTYPDQRLGQLLVNVIRPGQPCPQVFYVEDTVTEANLVKYLDTNSNGSTEYEVTPIVTKANP